MTPLEYKQFCESTYSCPPGTAREEYLQLLLVEELGEVASLFAKAIRDGVERNVDCEDCNSTGFEEVSHSVADGRYLLGMRYETIRRICWECEQKTETIYGPEAVNRNALKKELGDVMWCCALLSRTPSTWPAFEPYEEVCDLQSKIMRMICNSGSLHQAAELCVFLGFTPEEVALENHGAGDER